jgi:hypothetical protein
VLTFPFNKKNLFVLHLLSISCGHRTDTFSSDPSSSSSSSSASSSSGYVLLDSSSLWEINLLVLVRTNLLNRITNVESSTIATGVGDVLGNKGGCAVAFNLV